MLCSVVLLNSSSVNSLIITLQSWVIIGMSFVLIVVINLFRFDLNNSVTNLRSHRRSPTRRVRRRRISGRRTTTTTTSRRIRSKRGGEEWCQHHQISASSTIHKMACGTSRRVKNMMSYRAYSPNWETTSSNTTGTR